MKNEKKKKNNKTAKIFGWKRSKKKSSKKIAKVFFGWKRNNQHFSTTKSCGCNKRRKEKLKVEKKDGRKTKINAYLGFFSFYPSSVFLFVCTLEKKVEDKRRRMKSKVKDRKRTEKGGNFFGLLVAVMVHSCGWNYSERLLSESILFRTTAQ